jgi:hypothetical protein
VGNFRAVQVVLWQRKYEKMAIVDTFWVGYLRHVPDQIR